MKSFFLFFFDFYHRLLSRCILFYASKLLRKLLHRWASKLNNSEWLKIVERQRERDGNGEWYFLLTAICNNFLMALLLPVPQYAIASVYIPERRNTGSLSVDKLVTSGSASSKRAYIVNAIPTAKPRNIFSCWVSWAYWKCGKKIIY